MYFFTSLLDRRTVIATVAGLAALLLFQSMSYAQTNVASGTTSTGYTLAGSAVAVDPNISVTATAPINGFKVTISSGLRYMDALSYTGSLPSGVSASYNSSTGVLTFTGSASAADWQTLLRTVTFSNANTSQYGDRTITFSAGTLAAASNGHYYELVSSMVSWTAAKSAAESRTYLGYTGYLATITSDAENNFIRQVLASDSWIGASDDYSHINTATGTTTFANQSAAEGKWYWVTGPEKGTLFSTGNISPVTASGQYANWNGAEPNNSGSNEHYGQIYSSNATGKWNDLPNSNLITYVVEYGGLQNDPVQVITANTTIYTNISSNSVFGTQSRCYGTNAGTLTGVTPSGGNGSYSYQWISSSSSATSGFSNATGTSTSINYSPGAVSATTWFRRVVTSGAQSDTSSAVQVTVNPQILATATITDVLCKGGTTGTAVIAPSGGTAPYTYSWVGGNTSSSRNNLAAGNYTCVTTDAAGCTVSTLVTISEPTKLVYTSSQSALACFGDATASATMSPSGGIPPYQYLWSTGSATTSSIAGLSAGSYSCTVTDDNGCTTQKTFTIAQPAALQVTVDQSTPVRCNGGSDGGIQLSATGGTGLVSYSWDNGAVGASISNVSAGQYVCTVTDANGCTLTLTTSFSEPVAIQVAVLATDVLCNGGATGAASLSAGGGTGVLSFQWSNGRTTDTETGLSAGTYQVTITDQNACTAQETVVINEPPVLVITSFSATNITCFGANDGSALVQTTGGIPPHSYIWNGVATDSQTVRMMAPGTNTLIVQDRNGCEVNHSFSLAQPLPLQVAIQSGAATCNQSNGMAVASVTNGSGSINYTWSDGSNGEVLTSAAPGLYSVIATDGNGCSTSESVIIQGFASPVVNPIVSDAVCFGSSTGTITLDITASSAIQLVEWSNGSFSTDLTSVASGSYNYTVHDANGCETVGTVVVNEPSEVQLSAVVAGFDGGASGAIDLSVNGAAGYSFLWSNGETTEDITGLLPGDYTVTLTNDAGCTASLTVVVGSFTGTNTVPNSKAEYLTVFPNPNNGTFSVRASVAGTYQLYNTSGQVIRTFTMQAGSIERLTIDSVSAGVYFLRNITDSGSVVSRVMVR
ncbi:MAG: hypothetical protein RIQ47_1583 [Bacteroidota bacterium]|jgi:hypothetical protein